MHLVQGDVAESWREGAVDYVTVAMRYESIDFVRDRATGNVVSGDAEKPTESVELWTFTRRGKGEWLISAIQGAQA
ncbi:Tim44-like domain protein [compost metagenome]